MYTLFVLDYDATYNSENGVNPSVYLIPMDKQLLVERLAKKAVEEFTKITSTWVGIGDYFEASLEENNIRYQYIGSIELLAFEERQKDYLAEYIPREVV